MSNFGIGSPVNPPGPARSQLYDLAAIVAQIIGEGFHTIHHGDGPPVDVEAAQDGDYYIDDENTRLYGPLDEVDGWGDGVLLSGVPGPAGSTGPQGVVGPQGDDGPTGAQGPQGATGATGGDGPQGPTGLTGGQGVPGAQGNIGPAGPQGIQGPDGDQGPTGADGQTFDFVGSWSNVEAYDTNNVVSHLGASYIALQDNIGHEPDPDGDAFWDPLAIQGAAGPQGIQGIQGPVGAQGVQGDDGVAGPQGNQGIQGIQGATGAKGDAGDVGPTGPQGIQGAQGIQGTAGPNNVIVGKNVPALAAPQDGYSWVYNHATGAMVWTRLATKAELDDVHDEMDIVDLYQTTDDLTTTSLNPTVVDLGAAIVNVPAGDKMVLLRLYCPIVYHNVANKYGYFKIIETTDANRLITYSYVNSDVANAIRHLVLEEWVEPSAINRSFKVQFAHGPTSGGGIGVGLNAVLSTSINNVTFSARLA